MVALSPESLALFLQALKVVYLLLPGLSSSHGIVCSLDGDDIAFIWDINGVKFHRLRPWLIPSPR